MNRDGWSLHCVMLAVDVARFAGRGTDDEAQRIVRRVMYEALSRAVDDTRIGWRDCLHEDRGDGVLVIVPRGIASAAVVDGLPLRLKAELRRYNRTAGAGAELRLRAAVHAGEVHKDGHGLVGAAVNHLFRLLEATALRQALEEPGREVALLASDHFYESVIRHGSGQIDPGAYRQVPVSVKETETRGWLHVP